MSNAILPAKLATSHSHRDVVPQVVSSLASLVFLEHSHGALRLGNLQVHHVLLTLLAKSSCEATLAHTSTGTLDAN